MANSTWQRDSSTDAFGTPLASEGSYFLQAVGAGTAETSIARSASFNITSPALLFSFQILGSAVLEVQAQSETSTSNWTSVFSTGSQGPGWNHSMVRLPEGTMALQLLASVTTSADAVRVDALLALPMLPSFEDAACSFETDACSWLVHGSYPWSLIDTGLCFGIISNFPSFLIREPTHK